MPHKQIHSNDCNNYDQPLTPTEIASTIRKCPKLKEICGFVAQFARPTEAD